ncbi:hypothetical protein L3067_18025 [Xanthomonas sp. PPL568]|uniref:hypothetical protein n=1 Tax=Xanthomonas indica TaxID=2912242 RepID=UPI001F594660|nr:hypothetical protein [Xanthomonas indica]MCI2246512.1 hypothetical protein [Xanthomonas indica]
MGITLSVRDRPMSRFSLPVAAVILLAPALAVAQGLQPVPGTPPASRDANALRALPPSPRATPVPSGLDQRPQPAPVPAPRTAPIPSNLGDRPQAPAQDQRANPALPGGVADPAARRPVRLYDRSGQVIPGAMQVGPNRALDTRTGRYYDTVPSGDGMRIQD